ncbi:TFIIE alpha subunit family protein [Histomonas meleagridis]|uniref:TFIIE alpha subunit family protein n=1 Tax=Histomonas meleagridis TaxID=135588 RepID=UPI00355A8139|nr:TFIIE alpha subunit family protein [Histomonas meleagridis]KAH0796135.1 TFIIE alpha subunit family protein [Histomonas meleagridis]
MSYLKGNAQDFESGCFEYISSGISTCVADLRSTLVKWSSLYIASAAQTLGATFATSIEILLPPLFKQLSHGTSIISNSCHFALLEIGLHVQHRRTARAFLVYHTSKANIQRIVVAEFISNCIRTWKPNLLTSFEHSFNDVLRKFVTDPSASVRKIAKENYNVQRTDISNKQIIHNIPSTPQPSKQNIRRSTPLPKTPNPKTRKTLLRSSSPVKNERTSQKLLNTFSTPQKRSSSPTRTERNVPRLNNISPSHDNSPRKDKLTLRREISSPNPKKTRSKSPKKGPKKTMCIEEFMPPKSQNDTKQFINILNEITSNGNFELLDGLEPINGALRLFMENPLEELVKLVAYMFYEGDVTMVLVGLLGIENPMNQDELSHYLKFRKSDLGKVLGILHHDKLIGVETREDLTGVEDPDKLSEYRRKKLLKDYYAIDYKSFVDSVNLKIRLVLEELKDQCGPEDNIYYQCTNCQRKYLLIDLISFDDGQFECPICKGSMIELDDTDEINIKQQRKNEFTEMTAPLLELIKQTEGLVMIDDPDERCKSDSMWEKKDYTEKRDRIDKLKRTPKVRTHVTTSTDLLKHTSNVIVVTDKVQQQQPEIKDMKVFVDKEKKPEPVGEVKTIIINGKEYTAKDITDELLDSLPEDEFNRAIEFKEQNE